MEKETIGALYKSTELSEKNLLNDILSTISDSFHKQKAKDFSGSFHFTLECDGEETEFSIQVNNSDLKIIPDYADSNPYLNIRCSFETFCNITLGNFNPVVDIVEGKIQLDKGLLSLMRFAKFGSLFSFREIDLKLPTSIKHPESWVKPGKILLINGSPRKNASTRLMLDWFKEGLPSDKTDVIDVSTLKVARCLHCFKCWTDHPGKCVIDDDATLVRRKINEAELIVFFVPLSIGTMPSDLKRLMERLFPETTPFFFYSDEWKATAHPVHKNRKSQAFMQFLVWGFPEMKHGRLLEENFREWTTHSQRNNLGSISRPGINMILGDPRMQFIRKKIRRATMDVATSVYESGIIPKDKKAIIEKENYISLKDFHFYATKYWIKRFKTDYWN